MTDAGLRFFSQLNLVVGLWAAWGLIRTSAEWRRLAEEAIKRAEGRDKAPKGKRPPGRR